jgi:hypothetical protein
MTAHICFITHQSLMHIILSHMGSASRCVPATLLQLRMPGERTRPLERLLKPMRPSGSTSRLGFLLALACLEQASFSSLTHTTAHQQHRATYRTTLLSRALRSQKNSWYISQLWFIGRANQCYLLRQQRCIHIHRKVNRINMWCDSIIQKE